MESRRNPDFFQITVARRILIVDDDAALLLMLERFLSRMAYEVAACSGSGEAWALFQCEPSAYPLVLADFALPGMSGAELAAKMLELNPQVRVLLASGYAVDISGFPAGQRARIGFLKKPFTPEMLAKSVKETFGE